MVPSRTWARVQATTSTISSARQAMVSERDVMASHSFRLARFIEAEAPEQLHEVLAGRADRAGVPRELDEPGVSLDLGEARDEPLPGSAAAREVVDLEGPRLRRERLPGRRERRLVERLEPDLPAPAVHVRELAAGRAGEHHDGRVDGALHRHLEAREAHRPALRLGPALRQR